MAEISYKDYLTIAKVVVNALINQVSVKQKIVESLSKILTIERCSVFKVFWSEDKRMFCELVAGVPVDEHGIGVVGPLSDHPDIKEVIRARKVLLVNNPKENPLTSYFRSAIEQKGEDNFSLFFLA